jgi:hypothetical protein
MQTKSTYRVLKWTFIFGAMASLGTACVVTSGDGGDDPFGDGGESGSSTAEAGKTSKAGTGGTSTAGTTSGGSAGTTTTPAAGAGGEGEVYMAGLCDADEPDPTKGISSGKFPSCAPSANDADQDCKKCLKDKCCEAWQICYGSEPHIACGWGATEAADGQWDCVENCIVENKTGEATPEDLLATCTEGCTNQCNGDGGNLLIATSDLITCANDPDTCETACFPFN